MAKGGTRWPATLYDYELEELVDEDVAEVDLERGEWVRCRCCARQLVMKNRFAASLWATHKRTKAHHNALKRAANASSARKSPQYADFADAMKESIEKDTDYLVFYRQELEKRAKVEVKAKELVRETAMLVAEQQDDIDTLRDEVDDLKEIIQELRGTVDELHQEGKMAQQSRRMKKRKGYEDRCFVDAYDANAQGRQVQHRLTDEELARVTSDEEEEIDMFDDQVQLMQ